MEKCANGAYHVGKTFEIWVPRELQPDEILQMMRDWVRVAAGSALGCLKTSRWRDSAKPIAQFGLLISTHDIGPDAFFDWCNFHMVIPKSRMPLYEICDVGGHN